MKRPNKLILTSTAPILPIMVFCVLCNSCSTTYRAPSCGAVGPDRISTLHIHEFGVNGGPGTSELYVTNIDGTEVTLGGAQSLVVRSPIILELPPSKHTITFEYTGFKLNNIAYGPGAEIQMYETRMSFSPKQITKTVDLAANKTYRTKVTANTGNATWSIDINSTPLKKD